MIRDRKWGKASGTFWLEQRWALQGWCGVTGVTLEKMKFRACTLWRSSHSISVEASEQTCPDEKVLRSAQLSEEPLDLYSQRKWLAKGKSVLSSIITGQTPRPGVVNTKQTPCFCFCGLLFHLAFFCLIDLLF